MEEGHPPPCVDIEGNGGGGGGVVPHPGAEIEVRSAGISPPAVAIKNRRERRGIAPPRAVGVENGREGVTPPHAAVTIKPEVGCPSSCRWRRKCAREKGQRAVAIETERGVGAKPVKSGVLSS